LYLAFAGSAVSIPRVEFVFNTVLSQEPQLLKLDSTSVPLVFIRNRRARRYVLRLRPDGIARVTVPRGGSLAEARAFAERNTSWLERHVQKMASQPRGPVPWPIGTEILFRGERVRLETSPENHSIAVGDERVSLTRFTNGATADLRPVVERHLRRLASRELPPRTLELATLHELAVTRVTVRNQRSRWGSCSRRGAISLNWRLVQAPIFVRDYIILHELMHLRQMNHSRRFWREVEAVCPGYRAAEAWLKAHAGLLR